MPIRWTQVGVLHCTSSVCSSFRCTMFGALVTSPTTSLRTFIEQCPQFEIIVSERSCQARASNSASPVFGGGSGPPFRSEGGSTRMENKEISRTIYKCIEPDHTVGYLQGHRIFLGQFTVWNYGLRLTRKPSYEPLTANRVWR